MTPLRPGEAQARAGNLDVSTPPWGAQAPEPSGGERARGTACSPQIVRRRSPAQAAAAAPRDGLSPPALPAGSPARFSVPRRRRPGAGGTRSHARRHIRHRPLAPLGSLLTHPPHGAGTVRARMGARRDRAGSSAGPPGSARLPPPAHACAAAGERAVASAGAGRGRAGRGVPGPAPAS